MAEQTITLTASAYSVSSSTNFTVTNPSNAYVNIANATYNSYTQVRSTTTSTRYAYFYGFDFSQIPSDATVTSMVFKIVAGIGGTASSNCTVSLRNRTTNTALSSEINTPTMPSQGFTTTTLTLTSLSYDDVIALGDSFAFAAKLADSPYNSQVVFGMEIAVTYGYPEVNKVDYIKDGVLKNLIDLTGDDTLPEDVTAGKIFHLATGEQAVGTGGGLEYETGTWSPSSNTTTAPTINFANTHTEQPAAIAFADVSTSSRLSNYFISYTYTNLALLIPDWAMPSGGSWKNRYHYYVYASSTSGETAVTPNSANINVSNTAFVPYINGKSLRSSRVYNWIAIWV